MNDSMTDAGRADLDELAELASNINALMLENADLCAALDVEQGGISATMIRLMRENTILRERNSALMDEKNTAIRAAKSLQKKVRIYENCL